MYRIFALIFIVPIKTETGGVCSKKEFVMSQKNRNFTSIKVAAQGSKISIILTFIISCKATI
jgi:hypothetical protein